MTVTSAGPGFARMRAYNALVCGSWACGRPTFGCCAFGRPTFGCLPSGSPACCLREASAFRGAGGSNFLGFFIKPPHGSSPLASPCVITPSSYCCPSAAKPGPSWLPGTSLSYRSQSPLGPVHPPCIRFGEPLQKDGGRGREQSFVRDRGPPAVMEAPGCPVALQPEVGPCDHPR